MKHFAKKKWGQNFLIDPNLLRKIVSTINPSKTDNILEIGPGEGALTDLILPIVNTMAVIEIDPVLVEHLRDMESMKDVHVIHGDDFAKIEIKTLVVVSSVMKSKDLKKALNITEANQTEFERRWNEYFN